MASRRRPRDAVDESEGCQGRSIIHVILDDDREDVVAPDQTAVEEGEARRHEINQRTGDQDPGRVAVVDLARALAHGLRVLEGTWDVGRRRSRLWQRFVAFI